LQKKKSNVDSVGLSHEEATRHLESKQNGIVPIMPAKVERFDDYGSYIKASYGCGATGEFLLHDNSLQETIQGGVISKSPTKRTIWMWEGKDITLFQAPGLEPTSSTHTDLVANSTNSIEGLTFGLGERFEGFGSLYYNSNQANNIQNE